MAVSVDFDGVLHTYEHGWHDGTIYGGLVPGALAGLRALLQRHAVFVQTCRSPLFPVAEWLTGRTGIPAVVDTGAVTFWNESGRILVTGRKLPALVYVDDRGYRFEGWDQMLLDLPAFEPDRPLIG